VISVRKDNGSNASVAASVLLRRDDDDIPPSQGSFLIPLDHLQQRSTTARHGQEYEPVYTWPLLENVLANVRNNGESATASDTEVYHSIISCMDSAYQRKTTTASDKQKFNTLKGRWWGKTSSDWQNTVLRDEENDVSGHVLARGMLFVHDNLKSYMILNVFRKSYNKWRVEDSGVATAKTKVQAVCVHRRLLHDSEYEVDDTCTYPKRFILLNGTNIKPFARIGNQGWVQSMPF